RAGEFMREHWSKKLELMVVGKKARDTFRKRGLEFVGEYLDVSARVEFSKAKEIATRIADLYISGEVDAVYAVYNEFKNVMVQNLTVQKLLPIDPEVVSAEKKDAEKSVASHAGPGSSLPTERAPRGDEFLVDYIYEQPVDEIFKALLPRYLETEIFRILLESAAAEH